LELAEEPSHGTLTFNSPIAQFEVDLAQIDDEPFIFAAGGEGLQVTVEYLPVGAGSRHVNFEATVEIAVAPEPTAVYVRLTQIDGARAWSSPFYASRR